MNPVETVRKGLHYFASNIKVIENRCIPGNNQTCSDERGLLISRLALPRLLDCACIIAQQALLHFSLRFADFGLHGIDLERHIGYCVASSTEEKKVDRGSWW